MKVLVFDTETTGLPQTKILSSDTLDKWPHIVQLSYIVYDVSLNEISSKSGVLINNVLTELCSFMRGVDCIVGHNISFDINMIKVELLRIIHNNKCTINQSLKDCKYDLHLIFNYNNIYCTLQESITFCNITAINKKGETYLKYPKLVELHEKLFYSSPNKLHNSLIDILVTLRCFMKLKHNIDINDDCNSFKTLSSQLCIL